MSCFPSLHLTKELFKGSSSSTLCNFFLAFFKGQGCRTLRWLTQGFSCLYKIQGALVCNFFLNTCCHFENYPWQKKDEYYLNLEWLKNFVKKLWGQSSEGISFISQKRTDTAFDVVSGFRYLNLNVFLYFKKSKYFIMISTFTIFVDFFTL